MEEEELEKWITKMTCQSFGQNHLTIPHYIQGKKIVDSFRGLIQDDILKKIGLTVMELLLINHLSRFSNKEARWPHELKHFSHHKQR